MLKASCRSLISANIPHPIEVSVEGPRDQLHPEGLRTDGHADDSLEARHRFTFGQLNREGMHDRGKEQKQFHAGQDIAETTATTDAERDKVLRLVDLPFGVQETARVELLRLVPQRRVHVDAVDQGHHVRTGRDCVTVDNDITAKKNEMEENRQKYYLKLEPLFAGYVSARHRRAVSREWKTRKSTFFDNQLV